MGPATRLRLIFSLGNVNRATKPTLFNKINGSLDRLNLADRLSTCNKGWLYTYRGLDPANKNLD